ncbi:xanthine dehydrogenase accessory protein XdhC [Mesorhizobium sp. NBSH29]|uniref:xanthine dehydrogenase accessory protein XdhC n=1 Tax=Mesorhizobium sp. NBSH29 TaxID=2654249 RepID=UPI0018966158|nr:xanthine dehydrogenase accessory protein XdhC [Mesorhizobium sp. NBSH29]QPC88459.1 xanthine dehydrogenase accessory protein XdhC [Mesorhizobium sp. NBSH29]
MARIAEAVGAFLAQHQPVARLKVNEAKGSTPREEGAWMLVSADAIFGTIGGGQLEFMAIDAARELLAGNASAVQSLDVPLGPEIGQCCGGRVGLAVELVTPDVLEQVLEAARIEDARHRPVFLFGGGHVGHALASALSPLPLQVHVIETRADALIGLPNTIETQLTAVPEEYVRSAPAGSAFVVLTHDHALDFMIVAAALARDDAAYIGMIGSKTKRATFTSWYLKTADGDEARLPQLVSPIGGDTVDDKRPAVIAALAAAEIVSALLG